ncbi:MAG: OmpA family protein [Deltaproteobacteria bacterium]|nr:OmpA family protein [Deltaproteobacteria bacterium]
MTMNRASEHSARSGLRLLALPVLGLFLTLASSGCSKSYPDCDGDKTCASHNEVCVDGRCRQCRDDSQCSKLDACMTCQANECVRKPNCCKGDYDCPNGRCNAGECKAECSLNSDCPDGKRCQSGRCVEAATGCTDDSQCGNGLKCKNGECTTACELSTVYFDFDEYAIRLDQEKQVKDNAACLKASSYGSVVVEGHTDERGADEYNLILGEKRAKSVSGQYNVLGVKNLGRILSFGEEKPTCTQENEGCWKKNRRAETKVN